MHSDSLIKANILNNFFLNIADEEAQPYQQTALLLYIGHIWHTIKHLRIQLYHVLMNWIVDQWRFSKLSASMFVKN